MIGYEFEFLVREGNRPLSQKTFCAFHDALAKEGWTQKYDPGTGGLVGSAKDDFFVTTDDGVCTMEINTPPRQTIGECHAQLTQLLLRLQRIYHSLGCSIIGASVFPGEYDLINRGCKGFCADDQCCNKSYIKYFNAQRFPEGHHALFVFAANQVWLDVEPASRMRQWNAFQALSPVFYALFSNGPVFNNAPFGVLEGRDVLWNTMLDSSIVGNDAQYFGMRHKPFATLIEYFDFIMGMPFYFNLRDGKGYKLADPRITCRDFFFAPESEAEWFDGTRFIVQPLKSDFYGLQQRTFPHVRIKYRIRPEISLAEIISAWRERDEARLLQCFERVFLECRNISAQPQNDLSAGPAFLLGLQECIDETETIAKSQPYAFWQGLYREVQLRGLSAEYQKLSVSDLAQELLRIARRGLEMRGCGEEQCLNPLEARIARKENPGQELLKIWRAGGLEAVWWARDFV